MLTAYLLACALACGELTPITPGDPFRVTLDSANPTKTFTWTSDLSGHVVLWAASETLDPALCAVSLRGEPENDDDGGGGKTACLILATEPGFAWRFELSGVTAEMGTVTVRLVAMPESRATRAAAIEATDRWARLPTVGESGDYEWAQAEVASTIASLLAIEGCYTSLKIARAASMLATSALLLNELQAARTAANFVVELNTRAFPCDHPELQSARQSLAQIAAAAGDLAFAQALQEQNLDIRIRTLPGDDPAIQQARCALAQTALQLGDLSAARALIERVMEAPELLEPDHEFDLQMLRLMLAWTLHAQGDFVAARALEEQVLHASNLDDGGGSSAFSEAPGSESAEARLVLAMTLREQGDLAGARALLEEVLDVWTATLPRDHAAIQIARLNLAETMQREGDYEKASQLEDGVLDVWCRAWPFDHPFLQAAYLQHARTIEAIGDLEGARALEESVLEVRTHALPDDHGDLESARQSAFWTSVGLHDARRARELDRLLRVSDRARFSHSISTSSAREACDIVAKTLRASASRQSSLAKLFGALPSETSQLATTLATLEAAKSIAMRAAAIAQLTPEADSLRTAVAAASADVVRFAMVPQQRDAYLAALRAKDRAERERVMALATNPDIAKYVDFPDLVQLGAKLPRGSSALVYVRWVEKGLDPRGPSKTIAREIFSAFILSAQGDVARVDLEDFQTVEIAATTWRDVIGPSGRRGSSPTAEIDDADMRAGVELRRLVIDPILRVIGDAKHLIVVLDEPLQGIPLDALPLGGQQLGDAFHFEVHSCLSELLFRSSSAPSDGSLLALGGIDYFNLPESSKTTVAILRDSPWARGFAPLRYTMHEVDAIHAMFTSAFAGQTDPIILTGSAASRDALFALGPSARFLHVATHGFFAPESIASAADLREVHEASPQVFSEFGNEVRGLSPMVLCGLALAGANGKPDEMGRIPGIVTAEELATLDLRNCELAVLSACDTNVGVVRAGQGIASLQTALHMAGARSVITSLWKVPDEATQKLMIDFYRRIWIEKEPKWQALWNAKKTLRDAKNPDGSPAYSMADWAGWVLTGEQN